MTMNYPYVWMFLESNVLFSLNCLRMIDILLNFQTPLKFWHLSKFTLWIRYPVLIKAELLQFETEYKTHYMFFAVFEGTYNVIILSLKMWDHFFAQYNVFHTQSQFGGVQTICFKIFGRRCWTDLAPVTFIFTELKSK